MQSLIASLSFLNGQNRQIFIFTMKFLQKLHGISVFGEKGSCPIARIICTPQRNYSYQQYAYVTGRAIMVLPNKKTQAFGGNPIYFLKGPSHKSKKESFGYTLVVRC